MDEETLTNVHITFFYTTCRSCDATSGIDLAITFSGKQWARTNDYRTDEFLYGQCPSCRYLNKKPIPRYPITTIAKAGVSICLTKDKYDYAGCERAKRKIIDTVCSFRNNLTDREITEDQLITLIVPLLDLCVYSDYMLDHRIPHNCYARVFK